MNTKNYYVIEKDEDGNTREVALIFALRELLELIHSEVSSSSVYERLKDNFDVIIEENNTLKEENSVLKETIRKIGAGHLSGRGSED